MIENRIENIFKLFRTAFKMRKVNAETAKKVADSVADGYELTMTGDTGDWFDYSTVLKFASPTGDIRVDSEIYCLPDKCREPDSYDIVIAMESNGSVDVIKYKSDGKSGVLAAYSVMTTSAKAWNRIKRLVKTICVWRN